MQLNLDFVLTTVKGTQFNPPSTLGDACFMAIDSNLEGDEKLGVEARLKMFRLLAYVTRGGTIELTSEQITMIKDRLARIATTQLFGAAVTALEGGAAVTPPAGV